MGALPVSTILKDPFEGTAAFTWAAALCWGCRQDHAGGRYPAQRDGLGAGTPSDDVHESPDVEPVAFVEVDGSIVAGDDEQHVMIDEAARARRCRDQGGAGTR